jgi:PAS domain S-box-containing protein
MRTILLMAVAVVSIPAIAVLAAQQAAFFRLAREREIRSNFELARSTAAAFSLHVQSVARQINVLGPLLLKAGSGSNKASGDLLGAYVQAYPDVDGFYWTDAGGRIIAASRPEALGASAADQPYYQELVRGREWTISDLLPNRADKKPAFVIARAVRDSGGRLQGAIIAQMNRRYITSLLEHIARPAEGRLTLFDSAGTLVAIAPPINTESEQERGESSLLKAAMEGREASGEYVSRLDGTVRYGARIPVPQTRWIAGASIGVNVETRPLYRSLAVSLGWMTLVAGLSLFLVAVIYRRVLGSLRDLEGHAQALAEGNLTHRVREHGIDELDQLAGRFNRMAESIRENEELLRQSEVRFRTLVETMPTLAWTAASAEQVEYLNRQGREYTGLPANRAQGDLWPQVVHPDDLARTMEAWHQSLAAGAELEIHHRLRRADGAYRWHLTRAVPLHNGSETATKWFGISADVEEMRRMQDELARSNRDLEQFASMVSHDLQQPLVAIGLSLNVLKRDTEKRLDAETRKVVQIASDAARGMQEMIRGMLDYARVESRGRTFEPANLEEVLSRVLSILEEPLRQSGGIVTHDMLPTIQGDQIQLSQLFQNLLGNAIKFRDPARPLRIHVGVRQEPGKWLIEVRDNGVGIPARAMKQLFRIFFRAHDSRKYAGTGIGLAICKRIVERHGGQIRIEAEVERGTVVCLAIPAAP